MNEAEWLAERNESQQMLWPLQDTAKVTRTKAGRRKCRLFACGCCRLLWEHLHDPKLREAVEVAERHAEGLASKEELASARNRIEGIWPGSYDTDGTPVERTAAWMATSATQEKAFTTAVHVTALPQLLGGYKEHHQVDEATLCGLLRCIFGNPFRPATVAPAWRAANDKTAARVAQGIHDERAFDRLPVLADALEDAGCDDPEILSHCRSAGPHALGCWVVDACLGRSYYLGPKEPLGHDWAQFSVSSGSRPFSVLGC